MQLINAKGLRSLLLVAVLGFVSSAALLFGQGTSGSLTGQVTDPSGAAIPGAAVALTDVDTNYTQNAVTDGQGVYLFKLLEPGHYALTVVANSFAEYVQKGIVINANLYATQNVQLKVATAKGETINVTANAELIDTTSAELGMTINEAAVSELPLNGRDPSSLALLAPGMLEGNRAGVAWQQNGFSFPASPWLPPMAAASAALSTCWTASPIWIPTWAPTRHAQLRRHAGVPPDHQQLQRRLWLLDRRRGFDGHQERHQPMARRPMGFHAQRGFRRIELEQPPAGRLSAKPVRRLCRRTGPQEQAVLLLQLPGNRPGWRPRNNEQFHHHAHPADDDWRLQRLITYAQANSSNCGSGFNVPASEQTTNCGWLNGPFHTVNGVPNQVIGGTAGLDSVALQFTNDGLPVTQPRLQGLRLLPRRPRIWPAGCCTHRPPWQIPRKTSTRPRLTTI